jgi:hypothetical protein
LRVLGARPDGGRRFGRGRRLRCGWQLQRGRGGPSAWRLRQCRGLRLCLHLALHLCMYLHLLRLPQHLSVLEHRRLRLSEHVYLLLRLRKHLCLRQHLSEHRYLPLCLRRSEHLYLPRPEYLHLGLSDRLCVRSLGRRVGARRAGALCRQLLVRSDALEDRVEHLDRNLRVQRAFEQSVEFGRIQGVDVLHIHARETARAGPKSPVFTRLERVIV